MANDYLNGKIVTIIKKKLKYRSFLDLYQES